MARLLNRLRVVFDHQINASNALDFVFRWHHDEILFYLDKQLPYADLRGKEICAGQLLPFVNKLGNLLKQSGMKRYDRVAIFKSNSPDYFFLALAVIKAGGIAVPINSGMSLEQLSYYLAYTGSKMLITDEEVFGKVIKSSGKLPVVKAFLFPHIPDTFDGNGVDLNTELEKMSDELEPVILFKDSCILIVHTSGTTGFPKGVISTSGSLISSVKGHLSSEPISRLNKICLAGYYNHLVYYVSFFTMMIGNYEVYPLTIPEPKKALEAIETNKINIFFAFSDVYLKMFNEGLNNYNLSSIKIWIATADASHEEHMKAFCQYGAFLKILGKPVFRSVFIDVIGTSEVGTGAIRRFYFSFLKPTYNRMIGRPYFGGPRVKVADENGRELGAGKPGRLMVKGKALFKGYWNAHDMTNGVIINDWWWTGDIVYRDKLGRYYHLDRASDVINSESGPVYSLPIEEILLTHPSVSEAVVIGVPDGENLQSPLAIIYPKTGNAIEEEAFLAWTSSKMMHVQFKKIMIVTPLDVPRGLTGKVLKRVLRERYAKQFAV